MVQFHNKLWLVRPVRIILARNRCLATDHQFAVHGIQDLDQIIYPQISTPHHLAYVALLLESRFLRNQRLIVSLQLHHLANNGFFIHDILHDKYLRPYFQ